MVFILNADTAGLYVRPFLGYRSVWSIKDNQNILMNRPYSFTDSGQGDGHVGGQTDGWTTKDELNLSVQFLELLKNELMIVPTSI